MNTRMWMSFLLGAFASQAWAQPAPTLDMVKQAIAKKFQKIKSSSVAERSVVFGDMLAAGPTAGRTSTG